MITISVQAVEDQNYTPATLIFMFTDAEAIVELMRHQDIFVVALISELKTVAALVMLTDLTGYRKCAIIDWSKYDDLRYSRIAIWKMFV